MDDHQAPRGRKRDRDDGGDVPNPSTRAAHLPHLPLDQFNNLSHYAYTELVRQLMQQNDLSAEAMAARNRANLISNTFLCNATGGNPIELVNSANAPWRWANTFPSLSFQNRSLAGSSGPDPLGANGRDLLVSQMMNSSDELFRYPSSNNRVLYNPQTAADAAARSLASFHGFEQPTPSIASLSRAGILPSAAAPAAATVASIPTQRAQEGVNNSHESALLSRNANSGHNCKLLYMPSDDNSISPFQRYARMQIELFEAQGLDVETGAQGRNKPVLLRQVGIRCVHCAELSPKARARAAVYYPSRLAVLYQAAQNIVNVHLPTLCESIPADVRQRLVGLDNKRSSVGGGKNYWSDCAKMQGVIDTEDGLRFEMHSSTTR